MVNLAIAKIWEKIVEKWSCVDLKTWINLMQNNINNFFDASKFQEERNLRLD